MQVKCNVLDRQFQLYQEEYLSSPKEDMISGRNTQSKRNITKQIHMM